MGFLDWFCGKKETATSKQFSDMMKKMSDDDFTEEKSENKSENKKGDE